MSNIETRLVSKAIPSQRLRTGQNDVDAVEIGSVARFVVSVIDVTTGGIAVGNITPGTYTLYRSRAGGIWTQVATGTNTEAIGEIYAEHTFSVANGWADGDDFRMSFTGMSASISGEESYISNTEWVGRITRESDIESTVISTHTNLGTHETAQATSRGVVSANLNATVGSRATQASLDSHEASQLTERTAQATSRGVVSDLHDTDLPAVKIDTGKTVASVISKESTTTALGTTTTIIDSAIGASEGALYVGQIVIITSGSYSGQISEISAWDGVTFTFTVSKAFGGAIASGVTYRIIKHQGTYNELNLQALPATPVTNSMGERLKSTDEALTDGIKARANNPTLNAVLGIPDGEGKSIGGNIGDFQANFNLQTLKAILNVPDTAGKGLYTEVATDRLDSATFGLSAIKTDSGAIKTQTDKLAGSESGGSLSDPVEWTPTMEKSFTLTNTVRSKFHAVMLDFTEFTVNATIRVYLVVTAGDLWDIGQATGNKLLDSKSWTTADPDGVAINIPAYHDSVVVSVQPSLSAGITKVYWKAIKEAME